MRVKITDIATYLPEKVVTNDDLSKFLDTSHEWIYTRTGIERRHVSDDNELTSTLAIEATKKLISRSKTDPMSIDAIVVSTTTGDTRFPSCACKVQGAIGAYKAFAFDVNAACAGFIYALAVADSMIKSMRLRKVLLIASETITKFVDWTDRSTCVLFGDGAGAMMLEATQTDNDGIIATKLYANGENEKYNSILAHNGEQNGNRGYITMVGRSVFKYAIDCMAMSMSDILQENNMTLDDVDWIIPHQANRRILESMSRMHDFPMEKIIITTQDHANTSSASIPLALHEGLAKGTIKKGSTLLFSALGAGLTWGSAIVKI